MAEKTTERSPFVERVPELQNRKWGGMEIEDGRAVVDDILKGGKEAVRGLIEGLQEVDDGTDWKERLLLYQLVTQCSVPEREKELGMVGEALLEASVEKERPAPVRTFLLQQLRLSADGAMVKRLAPLLKENEVQLLDAVGAVMVSIGGEARGALEESLKSAEGHAKVAARHALNQISKKGA